MQHFEKDTSPIRLIHAGDLMVPTGSMNVRDPLTSFPVTAFSVPIPVGTYPVMISVVTVDGTEDVIGAASLHLHEEEPVRWEMALCPGQQLSLLREGEIFGFSVDSGFGCFLDAASASSLVEWQHKDRNGLYQRLDQERKSLPASGWRRSSCHWGTITLDAEAKSNCVFFSTGFGDFSYASYFGYAADGRVVALLADFLVFGKHMPDHERFMILYRGQAALQ